MIRVAFRYNDSRLFARLVCLVQGGDSAHCEVSMRCVSDVHECVSASWVDGGVRVKRMALPADKWRIYEMPGDAADAQTWADHHRGAPYDWLGLLGFFVRRIPGFPNAWFCSEASASILGLQDPHRYDLALLESVCQRFGSRVQ